MARILLIEDDEGFRITVRNAIETMGHEVVEARNGSEGIETQDRIRADLILTDLMMPQKDGFQTIDQLKKDYPSAKIIAMSGGLAHGADSYLQLAEILGAHRVLKKPFSKDELRKALLLALESFGA